jgi:G3E family GTPase
MSNADAPVPSAALIPTVLVTGFLGSGKTTLLNGLLAHPDMRDTAVIVNEFGEVGLDHLLLETAFEDAVLLQSGCICCTVRGDLVDTLTTLIERRERGEIPFFTRVAIETTGLADPAPIVHLLMTEPSLIGCYRLERVVTTVDAVNVESQLAQHFEPAKQAALADRLVLTKTDLVAPAESARLTARLRAVNPTAPIVPVVNGRISPDALFAGTGSDGAAWLHEAESAETGDHDHGAHDGEHAGHTHGILSFCLVREAPVPWPALKSWLVSLASLRGPDLLRMKGIVNVAGRDRPVVLHGVQHVFHPPQELARWPSEDRRTRIVFITRGIGEERIGKSFDAAMRRAAPSAAAP